MKTKLPWLGTLPLLLVLVVGCGKKEKEDDKKDERTFDDRDLSDKFKEKKPPQSDDKKKRDDLLPKKDDANKEKHDTEPAPKGDVLQATGQELMSVFEENRNLAIGKYSGQLVEVTSTIVEMGLSPVGDPFLVLEGIPLPIQKTFTCYTKAKEPWEQFVPGQMVTMKGRCHFVGNDIQFKDSVLVRAAATALAPVMVQDLLEAYEKKPEEADKLHGEQFRIVIGEVAKVERVEASGKAIITFKKGGKVGMTCSVEGGMIERAIKLKPGDKIKVMAKVRPYNADEGVDLTGGLVFAR